MNIPTSPDPSHQELRASLQRRDTHYAMQISTPLLSHQTTRSLRVREVLQFGLRLCDAHICSSTAIETLVNDHIETIEAETSPFVPNALVKDEGIRMRMQGWLSDARVRKEASTWEVQHVPSTPSRQDNPEEGEYGQIGLPSTPPGGWIPPSTPSPQKSNIDIEIPEEEWEHYRFTI